MTERKIHLAINSTDEDLVDRHLVASIRRNPKEFDSLYKKFADPVFRYIHNRTGDTQVAEDLTSQTFLGALESIHHFRQDGYVSSWLFSIARNKVNDYFRRKKPVINIAETDIQSDLPDPLANAIQADQSRIIQSLIHNLSDDEQELLRLRFIAELSFAKIAHLLHKREDAVKKSFYRLLARLQSQVEVDNE